VPRKQTKSETFTIQKEDKVEQESKPEERREVSSAR